MSYLCFRLGSMATDRFNDIRCLRAGMSDGSRYSSFNKENVYYVVPAGKIFILTALMVMSSGGIMRVDVGSSTAGAADQTAVPTGWSPHTMQAYVNEAIAGATNNYTPKNGFYPMHNIFTAGEYITVHSNNNCYVMGYGIELDA